MAIPSQKVEIYFNLDNLPRAAFVLDDTTQGVLDNTVYKVAGAGWFDVTQWVQDVQISRGKSRLLDRFESGTANVTFNNSTRMFDPKYTGSIFFGGILPRLKIRISSNDNYVYYGSIDDWNISYDPAGPSFATIVCSDDFVFLNQRTLPAYSTISELSSTRIQTILDLPEILWTESTDIETGDTTLMADAISEGTVLLEYLQKVETTEQGALFMSRAGELTFHKRNHYQNSNLTFTDDGSGIKYESLSVIYGTELMYNQIDANALGGPIYEINDTTSQGLYGTLNLKFSDTLHNSNSEVIDMISWLVSNYAQPEYRFDRFTVNLNSQSTVVQNQILALDMGDVVTLSFVPSKIPPAIVQTASIIKIEHQITRTQHLVHIGVSGYSQVPFMLDDTNFGVLDTSNLSY